jgi:hypothetical protein
MSTNHGKEFTASADLQGRFEGLVAGADGQVQLQFLDGDTANMMVKQGVQYTLRFTNILSAGTGVTGTVLY